MALNGIFRIQKSEYPRQQDRHRHPTEGWRSRSTSVALQKGKCYWKVQHAKAVRCVAGKERDVFMFEYNVPALVKYYIWLFLGSGMHSRRSLVVVVSWHFVIRAWALTSGSHAKRTASHNMYGITRYYNNIKVPVHRADPNNRNPDIKIILP